jgi:hypothetical protein
MNEWNFRFINVEATSTITSMMKLLMEMLLFQLSQVFKNPEWKPMIDTWLVKFKVIIYLQIISFCYLI